MPRRPKSVSALSRLLDPYLTKKWVGLRMAHEATMMHDAAECLRQGRERVDAQQRHLLGTDPAAAPEDDSVINVGDTETHVHNRGNPWLGIGLLALALVGGVLGAAVLLRPSSPASPSPRQEQEFELQYQYGDGPWIPAGTIKR